jgi:hypothetical protein
MFGVPPMTERTPTPPLDLSRRRALQLFAAGLATSLASCGPPEEEIRPYVDLPEGLTPGLPLYFATAVPLAGFARGVLGTTYEGRPTRLEGNPRHPASLGASDIFAQAAVMSLYDPDRPQSVQRDGNIASWTAFEAALHEQMQRERGRGGAGLRILTGTVTSPTMLRQIQALLTGLPQAQWVRYEPVNDDAARGGAQLAFGRPLTLIPRFADASVVLTLDADPLGPGPMQIRNSHEWSRARQASLGAERFLRMYAVESMWRLTGANADERLALATAKMRDIAIFVANRLGPSTAVSRSLPARRRTISWQTKAERWCSPVKRKVRTCMRWCTGSMRSYRRPSTSSSRSTRLPRGIRKVCAACRPTSPAAKSRR